MRWLLHKPAIQLALEVTLIVVAVLAWWGTTRRAAEVERAAAEAPRRVADAERRIQELEAARLADREAAAKEAHRLRNMIDELQARVYVLSKYPPDPEQQRDIDRAAVRTFDLRYKGAQIVPTSAARVSRMPARHYSPWHLAFQTDDGRWWVMEYRRRYDGEFDFFLPPQPIQHPPEVERSPEVRGRSPGK